MKFNFEGVQSFAGAPVPANTYPIKVISVKPKTANQTNNPMWEFCFEIIDGEFKGRRLFTNVTLLKQTMWKLKAILRGFAGALELDLESDEVEVEPADLIGLEAYAIVTQRTDNKNNLRNEVTNTVSVDEFNAPEEDSEYDDEEEDEDE